MLQPGTKVKHGANTGVVLTAPYKGSVTFQYSRWGTKVTQRVPVNELKVVKEKT